ncbi:peptidoglycan-N-acetylmuramic acid deacetylase [Natranaerovirga pectinivora]|uniref:Peptidoglycan-N-acetylmuramic acid deacetylase n=1 Tax=Natranaerovirga pectinivora TaxID=682400 RepID=A0A4R3MGP9_9FIRM|nr:polysaccharide deacetylase family protein [Natranaerovirga pectinivora]TCT12300.1 peptidoglycan-N-acetylmuramic acid deacetylase [Natranaerovirga pectinivora]
MKTLKALLILAAVIVLVYQVSSSMNESKEKEVIKIVDGEDAVGDEKDEDMDYVVDGPIEEEIVVVEEPLESEDSQSEDNEKEVVVEVEQPVKPTPPVPPVVSNNKVTIDGRVLSNEKKSWWFSRNTENKRPTAQRDMNIAQYDAYYVVETDEKVMYLTFDEGYEYGFTPKILDVLKENDVHAAFFVTKPYIVNNPELVIRMVDEGHLVANHSVKHKSMPTLSDEEVIWEIQETERYFEEVTGHKMDPFFRPPMGEYSERVLYLTQREGYKSIFWSIAYRDWVVDDQPGVEFVYNHFRHNHHPGAIPLVHAVSESNTEALDSVLKAMLELGYRFGSLYELE